MLKQYLLLYLLIFSVVITVSSQKDNQIHIDNPLIKEYFIENPISEDIQKQLEPTFKYLFLDKVIYVRGGL